MDDSGAPQRCLQHAYSSTWEGTHVHFFDRTAFSGVQDFR